jgi:hypothetical protein
MKITALTKLSEKLPGWHFTAYGIGDSIACYPPGGPSYDNFIALSAIAPISAVCGPLYVVNMTIGEWLSLS